MGGEGNFQLQWGKHKEGRLKGNENKLLSIAITCSPLIKSGKTNISDTTITECYFISNKKLPSLHRVI
jgi:hypothetical protein